MTASKKHHYLPQFYLKGFANAEGEFYVFDKKTEEIRKTNPANSFFENHRNTGTIKEERSVLLEDMYAYFDGRTAPHLELLRKMQLNDQVSPEALAYIEPFISSLYWRIPEHDEILEKLTDKLSFAETGFDFVDKTGKSANSPEFEASLKGIDLWRKMYRVFVPLISHNKQNYKADYDNWRMYFRSNKFQLTGDNPVILEKFIDFGSLTKELIFPISSDRFLVHTSRNKPKQLATTFQLELDMLVLQRATRFVCCAEKRYLEFLVNELFSFSKNHDFKDKMTEKIFSHFH